MIRKQLLCVMLTWETPMDIDAIHSRYDPTACRRARGILAVVLRGYGWTITLDQLALLARCDHGKECLRSAAAASREADLAGDGK